jgi:hypothetical protein
MRELRTKSQGVSTSKMPQINEESLLLGCKGHGLLHGVWIDVIVSCVSF